MQDTEKGDSKGTFNTIYFTKRGPLDIGQVKYFNSRHHCDPCPTHSGLFFRNLQEAKPDHCMYLPLQDPRPDL